eukprot:COSAG02_NODE_5152_length_4586_cov_8.120348_1_plen_202_part_00
MIRPALVKLRDLPSMPPLCAVMPPFFIQYAPNTKRRETLKSVTHRAYGPGRICMPCVYSVHVWLEVSKMRHHCEVSFQAPVRSDHKMNCRLRRLTPPCPDSATPGLPHQLQACESAGRPPRPPSPAVRAALVTRGDVPLLRCGQGRPFPADDGGARGVGAASCECATWCGFNVAGLGPGSSEHASVCRWIRPKCVLECRHI